MPDLFELAVDHHCIWVICHSCLFGKCILLALPGDEESNGLFDVVKGQFFQFGGDVCVLAAVEEDDNAGVFRGLAERLIGLLVEHCDVCLSGLFCQTSVDPLQNGELLVDSLVLSIFLDLLGTVLVEPDGRVLGELELVFQTVVVSLSDVDLGHFELSLELSADEFPLAVEVDAGGVVGLVEVDEEGLS